MATLHTENLRFSHPGGTFRLVLDGLEIRPSEPLAVLGPSGAGKTTLLRLLAGLLTPEQGEVRVNGAALGGMSGGRLRAFRLRRMGLVFQDFALLDHLTVRENLLLPARFLGLDLARAESRARSLAEKLEIAVLWDRMAARLSQGERQRAAVARALVHEPEFVFADEPTASLDSDRRGRVLDLLLQTCRENGGVLVVVTHDAAASALFPRQLHVEELRA